MHVAGPAKTPDAPDRVRQYALSRQTLENATRHGWGGRGDHASGEVLRGHELGANPYTPHAGETLMLTGRGTGMECDVPQPGTR